MSIEGIAVQTWATCVYINNGWKLHMLIWWYVFVCLLVVLRFLVHFRNAHPSEIWINEKNKSKRKSEHETFSPHTYYDVLLCITFRTLHVTFTVNCFVSGGFSSGYGNAHAIRPKAFFRWKRMYWTIALHKENVNEEDFKVRKRYFIEFDCV